MARNYPAIQVLLPEINWYSVYPPHKRLSEAAGVLKGLSQQYATTGMRGKASM